MSSISSALNDVFNGKSELSGMKDILEMASQKMENNQIDKITIKYNDYTANLKSGKKGLSLSLKQQTEEVRQA